MRRTASESDVSDLSSELELVLPEDGDTATTTRDSGRHDLLTRLRNLGIRTKLDGVPRVNTRPGNAKKVRAQGKLKAKGKEIVDPAPPPYERYFERQTAANCGAHAVNNAVGWKMCTVDDLHAAAALVRTVLEKQGAADLPPDLTFATASGDFEIDCIQAALLQK